ncbi:uncharacterized protein A4U43_C01F24320 [Asparagus officinalis]|uniref:Uncharacterized protein n=1 Tax=Asparagus officinalis TaxID=4686 RepID=A0A5P1FRR9_ASPOF|nr:uncharacterized protein A4U43_C01F24320 [Asparagus officinalis]
MIEKEKMSVLRRSAETFRRSGSSGLVWDDRFLFGDEDQSNKGEDKTVDDFSELRSSKSMVFTTNNINCCSDPDIELPSKSKRGVTTIFKKSMSANAAKPSKLGRR